MTDTESAPPPDDGPPSDGPHLTTISHDGRFWDVYLEFAGGDDERAEGYRARLCFSPADRNEGEEPVRTAPIIIEYSYEEAVAKARAFEDRQLAAFLRSARPE